MAWIQFGALWKKADFYSGKVECPHCQQQMTVTLFQNKNKKKENHPDLRVNVLVDDKPEPSAPVEGEDPDDDLPF